MQRVGEAASGWIPPWFPDWDGPWSPFLPRKLILEERQQIPNDPWWNQPVPWAVRSDLGTLRYSGHQTRGFQDLRMIFERSSNQGCFNPSRTRRNLVIEILYITNCIYIHIYIYTYVDADGVWLFILQFSLLSTSFPYFFKGWISGRVESQDILPKLTLEKGHGLEEMMELDWGNFPKMAELFSEYLFDANPDLWHLWIYEGKTNKNRRRSLRILRCFGPFRRP